MRGAALIALVLSAALSGVAAAREYRSRTVTRHFEREYPCPSTGRARGACPGWIKDHIVPLACGGADSPENMQWQTTADARKKDRWETKDCRRSWALAHGVTLLRGRPPADSGRRQMVEPGYVKRRGVTILRGGRRVPVRRRRRPGRSRER